MTFISLSTWCIIRNVDAAQYFSVKNDIVMKMTYRERYRLEVLDNYLISNTISKEQLQIQKVELSYRISPVCCMANELKICSKEV